VQLCDCFQEFQLIFADISNDFNPIEAMIETSFIRKAFYKGGKCPRLGGTKVYRVNRRITGRIEVLQVHHRPIRRNASRRLQLGVSMSPNIKYHIL